MNEDRANEVIALLTERPGILSRVRKGIGYRTAVYRGAAAVGKKVFGSTKDFLGYLGSVAKGFVKGDVSTMYVVIEVQHVDGAPQRYVGPYFKTMRWVKNMRRLEQARHGLDLNWRVIAMSTNRASLPNAQELADPRYVAQQWQSELGQAAGDDLASKIEELKQAKVPNDAKEFKKVINDNLGFTPPGLMKKYLALWIRILKQLKSQGVIKKKANLQQRKYAWNIYVNALQKSMSAAGGLTGMPSRISTPSGNMGNYMGSMGGEGGMSGGGMGGGGDLNFGFFESTLSTRAVRAIKDLQGDFSPLLNKAEYVQEAESLTPEKLLDKLQG